MKKKLLSILLSVAMVVTMMPMATMTAFATAQPIGDSNVTWELSEGNTVLTIGGEGAMPDFGRSVSLSQAPWVEDGDNNITTVVIGSGVTHIGKFAFEDCSKVANLYIDSIGSWCRITFGNLDSSPFSSSTVNSSKRKLFVGNTETETKNLVIPEGVEAVPKFAFVDWNMLTSVEMPFVTTIGESAFRDCSGLTSVKMPSVTFIDKCAFYKCGLTSVEMPSVKNMGTTVFDDCDMLTSADIGSSITQLVSTFNSCDKLKSVVIRAETPPTLSYAFDGCDALTEIIVPVASEKTYKESNGWSDYKDIIRGVYHVNVADAANGTVTASPAYVEAMDYVADLKTITLTVTPDEGYQLKSLKYNDGEDHDITKDPTSGEYQFTMPAKDVTVTAEFEKANVIVPVELLTAKSSGNKAVKLSWNKVSGATKYVVYGNKCGKSFKKLKTTTGKAYTVKKISGKKLKAHKNYKFYVVAYTANGTVKGNSIHFITGNRSGKYANVKSIKAKSSTLTLHSGATKKIDATYKMYYGKKHIKKSHGSALRYISNCPSVATVSSSGVVTAKAAGTAIIYIQDIGGKYCKTTVTVKQEQL